MRFTRISHIFLACFLSMSTTAFSAPGCQKLDSSFSRFLEKFIDEPAFRLERTIRPLAFQGETPDGRRTKELTEADLRLPGITKILQPMSNRQLELEDANNDEKWATESTIVFAKDAVTVVQGSHGADVWSRTYRFQRNRGCWFLIGLQLGGL